MRWNCIATVRYPRIACIGSFPFSFFRRVGLRLKNYILICTHTFYPNARCLNILPCSKSIKHISFLTICAISTIPQNIPLSFPSSLSYDVIKIDYASYHSLNILQASMQLKQQIYWFTRRTALVFLLWMSLYYFSSRFHAIYCTPDDWYRFGIVQSYLLTSSPYCIASQWLIFYGGMSLRNFTSILLSSYFTLMQSLHLT